MLLLATPSATLPGDDLGMRGFITPPLGPDAAISQTFMMTADAFRSVEVFPAAVAGRPAGDVWFELSELYDVGDESRVTRVHSAQVPVCELLQAPTFTFAFPPIDDSRNRLYRLDLTGPASHGIAFWATKGDRYEGGTMEFNGNARWADIVFHTDASVPSYWALLMSFRETHPARAYAVAVAFFMTWLLLGLALRRFERLTDAGNAPPSLTPSTGSL